MESIKVKRKFQVGDIVKCTCGCRITPSKILEVINDEIIVLEYFGHTEVTEDVKQVTKLERALK